jgi:hypothetical protein
MQPFRWDFPRLGGNRSVLRHGPPRTRFVLAVAVALMSAVLLGSAASASAAPRNNDFGDAAALRVGKDVKGNINGATNQRGEPRHANSLATRSVWYRFRAKSRVSILLGTCSSSFDTVLAVYSGRRLGGLREVDYNNDGCGGSGAGSRVSFTARARKTYHIAVVGFSPSGRFTLTMDRIFTPPNDDFVDAVAIAPSGLLSASTRGATRELREPAHTDNAPHTIWFKLSVTTQTAVHLSTCNGSRPTMRVYTGSTVRSLTRVGGDDSGCEVTFTAVPGTTYRIVAEDGGSGGGFTLNS